MARRLAGGLSAPKWIGHERRFGRLRLDPRQRVGPRRRTASCARRLVDVHETRTSHASCEKPVRMDGAARRLEERCPDEITPRPPPVIRRARLYRR